MTNTHTSQHSSCVSRVYFYISCMFWIFWWWCFWCFVYLAVMTCFVLYLYHDANERCDEIVYIYRASNSKFRAYGVNIFIFAFHNDEKCFNWMEIGFGSFHSSAPCSRISSPFEWSVCLHNIQIDLCDMCYVKEIDRYYTYLWNPYTSDIEEE